MNNVAKLCCPLRMEPDSLNHNGSNHRAPFMLALMKDFFEQGIPNRCIFFFFLLSIVVCLLSNKFVFSCFGALVAEILYFQDTFPIIPAQNRFLFSSYNLFLSTHLDLTSTLNFLAKLHIYFVS